jgi:tetratricopeptide (TPR) repeat protein
MGRLGLLAALAFAACLAVFPAHADELQDIGALLKQGQHAQALDRVNRYLSTRPKDAQGRFLKGLILAEQNKTADAIEVFTKLSQDYPELPEPYNNVAVLYASQGQYEKARQALEMSIRTHPAYATAYENLGDVYSKLASQAYDKALQFDSGNQAAKTKLALMTEIISGTRPRPGTAIAAAPTRPVEVPKAPAAAQSAPQVAAQAPKAEPKVAPAPKAEPKPEPQEVEKAPSAPAAGQEEVLKTVQAWARSWSNKDVKNYLAHYAPDFKTPGGEPRATWAASRQQRIAAPKKIEVGVESPRVSMKGPNDATVTFRQAYRSDSLKTMTTKTLQLSRTNGKWLITQERVGR